MPLSATATDYQGTGIAGAGLSSLPKGQVSSQHSRPRLNINGIVGTALDIDDDEDVLDIGGENGLPAYETPTQTVAKPADPSEPRLGAYTQQDNVGTTPQVELEIGEENDDINVADGSIKKVVIPSPKSSPLITPPVQTPPAVAKSVTGAEPLLEEQRKNDDGTGSVMADVNGTGKESVLPPYVAPTVKSTEPNKNTQPTTNPKHIVGITAEEKEKLAEDNVDTDDSSIGIVNKDGIIEMKSEVNPKWHKAGHRQYADNLITIDSIMNLPYLANNPIGTSVSFNTRLQKGLALAQTALTNQRDNLAFGATFTVAHSKGNSKFTGVNAFISHNLNDTFMVGADVGFLNAKNSVESKHFSQNIVQLGLVGGGSVAFGQAFVKSLAGVRYHRLPAVNAMADIRADKANLMTFSSTNEVGYRIHYANINLTPTLMAQVIVPKNGQKVKIAGQEQASLFKTQYRLSAGLKVDSKGFYLNANAGTQNKKGFVNLAAGYNF